MQMIVDALRNCRRPLVLGHVNPDPDCIASVLVMFTTLRGMGKDARALLPPELVADRFKFMLALTEDVRAPSHDDEIDLIVVTDTALRKRFNLGNDYELPKSAKIVNIDHHLGNEKFGDLNWVDSSCVSATEMVFTLVEALRQTLTADQASLLYAGLHGDTCGFSLRGTSAKALRVGARLAEYGADIADVCQRLYRTMSQSEFRLMRLIYGNTRVTPCGQVAWSTVTYDELTAAGCKPKDIDEQVAVPRSIDGVRIAVLFSQGGDGEVRLNMRSEGSLNILPLAKSIGGGGHAQATGVMMEGPMTETVDSVVAKAIEYLAAVDAGSCNKEQANAG